MKGSMGREGKDCVRMDKLYYCYKSDLEKGLDAEGTRFGVDR